MAQDGVRIEFSDLEPSKDDVLFQQESKGPKGGLYNQITREAIIARQPKLSKERYAEAKKSYESIYGPGSFEKIREQQVQDTLEWEQQEMMRQYYKELEAVKEPQQDIDAWSGMIYTLPGEKERYDNDRRNIRIKYFGEE